MQRDRPGRRGECHAQHHGEHADRNDQNEDAAPAGGVDKKAADGRAGREREPVAASPDADRAFSTSWMGHRPTVAAALSIALLACALAITASIVLYRQLGF